MGDILLGKSHLPNWLPADHIYGMNQPTWSSVYSPGSRYCKLYSTYRLPYCMFARVKRKPPQIRRAKFINTDQKLSGWC
jgi:hypothetical protein